MSNGESVYRTFVVAEGLVFTPAEAGVEVSSEIVSFKLVCIFLQMP